MQWDTRAPKDVTSDHICTVSQYKTVTLTRMLLPTNIPTRGRCSCCRLIILSHALSNLYIFRDKMPLYQWMFCNMFDNVSPSALHPLKPSNCYWENKVTSCMQLVKSWRCKHYARLILCNCVVYSRIVAGDKERMICSYGICLTTFLL
jgi:hypothetical protein